MAFGDDHMYRPKKVDTIITEKPLPVILGHDYQHVMAKATIEQTAQIEGKNEDGSSYIREPAKVVITIIAEGPQAQQLGDFVAALDVVALSFDGVPVQGHHRKEH